MKRHSTFKFCLNPTAEQHGILARRAGAARFAFNQCLHMVGSALAQHRTDPDVNVPWTGYDLINTFNIWKRSEAAGRLFAIDGEGVARCLHGRDGAAVATGDLPASVRRGRRRLRAGTCRLVAVPQRYPSWPPRSVSAVQEKGCRRKADVSAAQQTSQGTPADDSFGRDTSTISDTPRYWRCWIRDDTCRLRHMLAKDRAKVLSATVIQQGGRWWVALNVAAADLHPSLRHPARTDSDRGGWVGLDRGLAAFVVAASADGHEVARIQDAPKALRAGMRQQRRLAKSLSRKKKGSHNRR